MLGGRIELRDNSQGKMYTALEDQALRALVALSKEKPKLNNKFLADNLCTIFDRTQKGLEIKLGHIRNTMTKADYLPETNDYSSKSIASFYSNVSFDSTDDLKINSDEFVYEKKEIGIGDIGKIYRVKVYNIMPYGAFCFTEDGKSGLLLKGLITTAYVKNVEDYLEIGDEFDVIVVPDKQNPNRVLFNAKAVGNIIAISDR